MPTEQRAVPSTYVLITPARNEAAFIELTIQSVLKQTVKPVKWVIVSDGSTDDTDAIVSKYVSEHPWIELIQMSERRERHFAGKVHAFNAGYARVKDVDYDVIASLDGDLSFDDEYFSYLLGKLREDRRLGLVGTPFKDSSMYDYRFVSLEHVSGACQMFRRECFEEIGGYRPVKSGGIDLIAVLSARAKGWRTRTFLDKFCVHHRKMGASHHTGIHERLHRGRMDYLLGSHPMWEIFRSAYQMKNPPYIVGGMLILAAYLWRMLCRTERTMPPELIEFRREDQMRQLRSILRRGLHQILPGGAN